ncbi:MAG: pyrroline-5-carboxylate reductase [Phycisphaeraceae bacterium]|nr:MAG: pyrroline-5-carboxylate reductase [Phycisphaeraceae bacterium]
MGNETPLAVIGGGTMARAIHTGATKAGVVGDRCVVAEPDASRRGGFARAVATAAEALAWVRANEPEPGIGQVLLAVKPQVFAEIAPELRQDITEGGPGRIVISILAGLTSTKLRAGLGEGARIVRVMPNTPAQISRGMSAISVGEGATIDDADFAHELFASVGRTIALPESMMDAFTALAGSGPAYVFYLAEAMLDAAMELGFERDQALTIVRETVAGAGELMRSGADAPRALRAAVTSKGGTTAAAIDVLDQAGVMDDVMRAVHAARHRGSELAGG